MAAIPFPPLPYRCMFYFRNLISFVILGLFLLLPRLRFLMSLASFSTRRYLFEITKLLESLG